MHTVMTAVGMMAETGNDAPGHRMTAAIATMGVCCLLLALLFDILDVDRVSILFYSVGIYSMWSTTILADWTWSIAMAIFGAMGIHGVHREYPMAIISLIVLILAFGCCAPKSQSAGKGILGKTYHGISQLEMKSTGLKKLNPKVIFLSAIFAATCGYLRSVPDLLAEIASYTVSTLFTMVTGG